MTAADVLVETLLDWGVEVIFGLPGDGINGIMESPYSSREDSIHSSPPRRGRRLYGLRLRKIYR